MYAVFDGFLLVPFTKNTVGDKEKLTDRQTETDTCVLMVKNFIHNKSGNKRDRTLNYRVKRHYFLKHLNPFNAELYPIRHLPSLLGTHPFLHVSRIRVNRSTRYLAQHDFIIIIIIAYKYNNCT